MASTEVQPVPAESTHNVSGSKAQQDNLASSPASSGISTPNSGALEKRAPKINSNNLGQATPPETPRTLSRDSSAVRTSSPNSNQGPAVSREDSDDDSMGYTKGKLCVTITEGRGLRPSVDPYIVCQFQYNEYISKGPRSDSNHQENEENQDRGVPIQRTASDMSRVMSIPMGRQTSHTSVSSRDSAHAGGKEVTDPKWNHEATFDVVGGRAVVDVSVYDHSNQEAFLGHVRYFPTLNEGEETDRWFKLTPREASEDFVTGEIRLKVQYQTVEKRQYGPEDFQILKLIGKGTFGQVFQVRKKDTQRVYAMKVLSKKAIVQKKEVAHTIGERNILVSTAQTDSPFIVGLKFSFQTPTDLYLVTDYMSGGELFWHLQKEGRFNEWRAKFYIAELILALQHLHQHDIVYRDLKPENILLDANGHIALCDFGLSKANLGNGETTNTFCGTTEYLAPEVLLDENGYTKMVDFWSLGVLVFEMCCGWSPFYAEDTQQMYKNIAFGKVRFPRDALSAEGRNFVKGLLNRNPKHRLGATNDAEELKAHPFFSDIDWDALASKDLIPPFKPRLKSELDTSHFDPEFTDALNDQNSSLRARAAILASGVNPNATPLSTTLQDQFKGFTYVGSSNMEKAFGDEYGYDGDETMADDDDDDDDLELADADHDGSHSNGERMSGVQRSSDADEGLFNAEGL